MARANRERDLARAVAKAFMRAGFSTADLLTGQIQHTNLPWQCPPLDCPDELDGHPFEDYLLYPLNVNEGELYNFWRKGLAGLYASPASVCAPQGWKNLGPVMRHASSGERALRFSVPEGFPKHNAYAGHVFTLEAVNVFATSTSTLKFVSDANNYYVETRDHGTVGIVDGYIVESADWLDPVTNIVDTLVSSPRGQIITHCRYDLLAKVRSVLHENAESFPEFVGVDYALQALYKLSQDRLCVDLLTAIENMVPDNFELKRKVKTLDESLDLLDSWVVNDRVKLVSMYEILVPAVYSVGGFYANIFNITKQIPAVLSVTTLAKIKRNLLRLREQLVKNVSARDREQLQRKEE